MALAPESFQQSKCLQFSQSACLMRVAGIVIGVEWRTASYRRTLPGFMPIFPDEDGTLTGQALELSKRRRFHARRVTSSGMQWGADWTLSMDWETYDYQVPESLVPVTTGGHSIGTNAEGYPVIVNDGKFFSGDCVKDITGGQTYYITTRGATMAQYVNQWEGTPGIDHTMVETREGEVDYKLEVDRMRRLLAGVDMARLWTLPPGGGLNRLNHRIYHDQFLWYEEQASPTLDLSFLVPPPLDEQYSSDVVEDDAYGETGLQQSTYISFGWGRNDNNNGSQYIEGYRVQFRCSIPITYSIIERVVTGEGGYGLCYVHADNHEAAAGEIIEVPMGSTEGDGLLPISEGLQAIGTLSAISIHFGKTVSQALAVLKAANGITWVTSTPPATPSADNNTDSADSNTDTIL